MKFLFAPLALIGLATGARASIVSDFNADTDGWTAINVHVDTLQVDSVPTQANGDPTVIWNSAGYISATEVENGALFLLSAPHKFLGAKGDYLGGTVSFDLSSHSNDGTPAFGLILVSTDKRDVLGYLTSPPATTVVPTTHLTVPLTTVGNANWFRYVLDSSGKPKLDANGKPIGVPASNNDLSTALSSLGYLCVDADWKTGTVDHTSLDNVVMAAPVPEPAPLAALGVTLVAFVHRRKS